tara:strand:- start:183 stop:401 length:219 start_codon:yes stop_codon:yes gene_type:complete
MSEEKIITIDGKDYKESELSTRCRNVIVSRSELQQSKLRHELELEKIDVLTNYYNKEIKKELEQSNGGDSKP